MLSESHSLLAEIVSGKSIAGEHVGNAIWVVKIKSEAASEWVWVVSDVGSILCEVGWRMMIAEDVALEPHCIGHALSDCNVSHAVTDDVVVSTVLSDVYGSFVLLVVPVEVRLSVK